MTKNGLYADLVKLQGDFSDFMSVPNYAKGIGQGSKLDKRGAEEEKPADDEVTPETIKTKQKEDKTVLFQVVL